MNSLITWAWQRALKGRPALLSLLFQFWIPFNRPHRFRILSLLMGEAVVALPARRWNQNHLKTQHACALATAGEFAAGLALLGSFSPLSYRLIMSRLEVDYLRRATGLIRAEAKLSKPDSVQLASQLTAEGIALITMRSTLSDNRSELVARVTTHWQVKDWGKVSRRM